LGSIGPKAAGRERKKVELSSVKLMIADEGNKGVSNESQAAKSDLDEGSSESSWALRRRDMDTSRRRVTRPKKRNRIRREGRMAKDLYTASNAMGWTPQEETAHGMGFGGRYGILGQLGLLGLLEICTSGLGKMMKVGRGGEG